ncbi:MAG: hypothetical protein ABH864_07385 [archaeon]
MQKRGELTSAQISTLILTIIGFVIALIFLLVVLDTQNLSEREICRLSVLTRATAPDALERLAPLKCTTQKICLTKGADCQQFAGEKNVRKVTVASSETIEKEAANAMYDCWKMMGEGKLDVFGGGVNTGIWSTIGASRLFQKKTVCTICSRLAIAEDVDQGIVKNVSISEYMETHQIPNSELTYLQAFTDQQIRSYPREFRENLTSEKDNYDEKQNTNEIAMIFMQIDTDETPLEAGTDTGIKSAAFLFTSTSAVSPIGLVSLKARGVLSIAGGAAAGGIAAIQTWQSRETSAGYCGEFTSTENARRGCSVVTPFNYQNAEAINDYCSYIEGQP